MEEEDMMMIVPSDSTPKSSKLLMHKTSHVISKFTPKIRIIHIFAPEIIKTDAANFRELVQRLTGKPTPTAAETKGVKKKKKKKKTKKLPSSMTMQVYGDQKIKEEENESSSNCFVDGFTDLDGFIEELIESY